MYPFGPDQYDTLMPEDNLYRWMCLELDFPDAGLEFYGRRHRKFSVILKPNMACNKYSINIKLKIELMELIYI
jgi:hypothetical protein